MGGTAGFEGGYTIKRTIRWGSRPVVGGGPNFSSGAPPRSPAPSFDHFPFGPAILRRRVPSGTCAWVRRNFSLGPAGRCDGEEAAEGRKWGGGERGPKGTGGGKSGRPAKCVGRPA